MASAASSPSLTITSWATSRAAHVRIAGDVDGLSAPQVHDAVTRAADGAGRVVVELGGVTFIDSCGLHVLLDADNALRSTGHAVELVDPSAVVRRLFTLVGLHLVSGPATAR